MARPEKIRLGDLLVQEKLISTDQLQFALEQQKRSGRKLGRVLVDNGFVSEDQISEAIAKQLNIPYINLKYYKWNSSSLVTRASTESPRNSSCSLSPTRLRARGCRAERHYQRHGQSEQDWPRGTHTERCQHLRRSRGASCPGRGHTEYR